MKKISLKDPCPCQSGNKYKECCEPFLSQISFPSHPEKLMRSRYTAFSLLNFNYIQKTMLGKALENFSLKDALSQSKNCKWISLKIIKSFIEENKNIGYVEFIAEYRLYGKINQLHEKSRFELVNGKWFYTNAEYF